jgi:hypothetical protein
MSARALPALALLALLPVRQASEPCATSAAEVMNALKNNLGSGHAVKVCIDKAGSGCVTSQRT